MGRPVSGLVRVTQQSEQNVSSRFSKNETKEETYKCRLWFNTNTDIITGAG
jgi:hypothetical protein